MSKYNKIIKIILLIAILIITTYIYTKDVEELFQYGTEIFYIANQIAIGYIVSYIFYLVTIYYPQKNKNKRLHNSLCYELFQVVKNNEKILSTVFLAVNEENEFEDCDITYISVYHGTKKHMIMRSLDEFDFSRKEKEVVPKNMGNLLEYSFYKQRFYEMYYESLKELKDYIQNNLREMIELSFDYHECKNIVDKSEELLNYINKFDLNKYNILLEDIKSDRWNDTFKYFISEGRNEYKLLNLDSYSSDSIPATNILRELYNLIHINVEFLDYLYNLKKSFQE